MNLGIDGLASHCTLEMHSYVDLPGSVLGDLGPGSLLPSAEGRVSIMQWRVQCHKDLVCANEKEATRTQHS